MISRVIWWRREVWMPAPYSVDLRERVVRAYLSGAGTYAEVASRFDVGEATVDRWVSRFRRAGSVEPDPMGGDRHSKFGESDEATLRELVEEDPDITRDELVRALADRGLEVSTSAVQRALERNALTRKKRRSTLRSETPTS
jgi:putative transposase